MMRTTVSGRPALNAEDAPVPDSARRPDGQHVDHWVLSAEERAKGFVRPVRDTYRHVGIAGPTYPLRDLTEEDLERFGGGPTGYAKYEEYPRSPDQTALGRFWTQEQLNKIGNGCGIETRMPQAIAETYAAVPGYYGSTFCCGCGEYLPVGRDGEFVWADTTERVGT